MSLTRPGSHPGRTAPAIGSTFVSPTSKPQSSIIGRRNAVSIGQGGSRRLSVAILRSRQVSTTRSEEHTSELQSLMRISYAVFCLKKKKTQKTTNSQSNNPSNTNTTHHQVTIPDQI